MNRERTGRAVWLCGVVAVSAATLSACADQSAPAVAQLGQARRLSTALLVRLTKASDASNRAVMADTDQASAEFAQEARETLRQVQDDATALAAILGSLHYDDEIRLLKEFDSTFEKYRALDRRFSDSRSRTPTSRRCACRSGRLRQPSTACTTRSRRLRAPDPSVTPGTCGARGHQSGRGAPDPGAGGTAHRRARTTPR